MSKKERIIIVLLASINFTHILDFMIMMPLGNYLIPQFNISPSQFSLLIASYPISSFIAGIAMFFMADRFERKKLLLITYSGFIIGTAACGFAQSYELLLVARIIAGLFGGVIGSQILSIIGDLFAYERRGAAMGGVMSAFAIASSAGVTFSLYLVDIFKDDWHAPFLFVALTAVAVFFIGYVKLPTLSGHLKQGQHPVNSKLTEFFQTIKNERTGLALLFSGLMMTGHFLIIPFITSYMEFNMGYSKKVIPVVYLVGGLSSLVAAIYLGRLSDRVGKLTVFSYCVPLSFVFVLLLTNLPIIPFSIVLVFFAVWFALATGRAVSSQTMVSGITNEGNRGSFMSLNSSVQHLGHGAAALIAGFIVSQNKTGGKLMRYEWTGYLSVFVLLAGFFIGRYLFKNTDGKKPKEVVL